jgi:penicillin-insensitive murein endopeptidase
MKIRKDSIMLLVLFFSLVSFAQVPTLPTTPLEGPAESFGGYSRGCFIGGETVLDDEYGMHQMRLKRGRYWGHPETTDYLKQAAIRVRTELDRDLLLSDISQPRGGPFWKSKHVSHQSGLDIDIWFRHIESTDEVLSTYQRENMWAWSVVKNNRDLNQELWTQVDIKIAKLLVSDERVTRILVHPVIKKSLCESGLLTDEELRKYRAWYGHTDHYHIRLGCPTTDTNCVNQAPPPEGNGCGAELDWC